MKGELPPCPTSWFSVPVVRNARSCTNARSRPRRRSASSARSTKVTDIERHHRLRGPLDPGPDCRRHDQDERSRPDRRAAEGDARMKRRLPSEPESQRAARPLAAVSSFWRLLGIAAGSGAVPSGTPRHSRRRRQLRPKPPRRSSTRRPDRTGCSPTTSTPPSDAPRAGRSRRTRPRRSRPDSRRS